MIPENIDGDTMVWRYVDFAKFYSMITSKSLFLCRADNFPDEFEGSYSDKNLIQRSGLDRMRCDTAPCDRGIQSRRPRYSNEELRKRMNICCFHLSDHESTAMWELYTIEKQGIAIQSTINRLNKSIDESFDIVIGKVNYVDYREEKIAEISEFHPFLSKRIFFRHEKELRVLLLHNQTEIKNLNQFGTTLPINLDSLIERIYISPKSSTWFRELIEHSLEANDLGCSVHQSNLDMKPIRV